MPRRAFCLFTVLLLAAAVASAQQDPAADYAKIREGLDELAPFVGDWSAVAKFHRDSGVVEQEGIYHIDWALEQTYLQFTVELHRKEDPSRHHGFVIYLTYNPASKRYESTYFYTRWALRVTETGMYDAASHQFRTSAFVPREDGVHDEHVRTITDFSNPDRIVYTHYSRYSNEKTERKDLEIILTRKR